MSFYSDSYFGLNVDGGTNLIKCIRISSLSAALLVQCIIGITAVRKMRKNRNLNVVLTSLFLMCLFCACAFSVCLIALHSAWGHQGDDYDMGITQQIVYFIHCLSIGCFFTTLLLIFSRRLYVIFKDTVYRMSSAQIIMFKVIEWVGLIAWIVFSVLVSFTSLWRNRIVQSMLYVVLCLYMIGCILALHLFVLNLSRLAKTLGITSNLRMIVTDSQNGRTSKPDDIKLRPQQRDLSNLAAKSMLLFMIAIGSTIISDVIIAFGINFNSGLRDCIYDWDLCVNLWCIYLQFAFAKDHYKKCCGCCDRRLRRWTSKETQRRIYKHSMDLMQGKSQDGSISPQLSISPVSSNSMPAPNTLSIPDISSSGGMQNEVDVAAAGSD